MMRFGKSKSSNMDLPMSYQSSKDGGGRSVQIDYPAARAIKNASLYTKTSYFGMFFFLGLSFFGVRELIYSGGKFTLRLSLALSLSLSLTNTNPFSDIALYFILFYFMSQQRRL